MSIVGSQEADRSEEVLDLSRQIRVIAKRKWLVLAAIALATAGGFIYAFRQPRIYESKCTLHIEPKAPNVLGQQVGDVSDVGAGLYWNNREYFETQFRILQSRDVAEATVRKLDLHKDPRFLGTKPGEPAIERTVVDAAQMLQAALKVDPVKDTRLVHLLVQHTNPEMAQRLANAVVDVYMSRNLERALSSKTGALDWLTERLDKLRATLNESERNLYEFKKDRNVLSVSLEDRQNLITSELTSLSQALTKTKAERLELEAQRTALAEAMKNLGASDLSFPRLSEDAMIQSLRGQYAKLMVDLSAFRSKYGSDHPNVRNTDAQLAAVSERLKDRIQWMIRSLEVEYRTKQKAEKNLAKALDEIHGRGVDLNRLAIEYNRLARERDHSSKLYELVLARSKETDLARLLPFNNISVLDRALTPTSPVSPRTSLIVVVACLLGLAAGLGLAFLLEFFDSSIKTQEDIQQEVSAPLLGVLAGSASAFSRVGYLYGGAARVTGTKNQPAVDWDTIAASQPQSVIAEAARSIRTNLMFIGTESPLRRVLVTSPSPREGKTFVTTTLGIVMAQSGKRVLILDTDLRRPRIRKIFREEPEEQGVTNYLAGQCRAEDVPFPTAIDNLFVAPAGPIPPNPAELLHTPRFVQLLDELSALFDLVVLDSPPLGVVTDAAILSRLVDGTIIVARQGKTNKAALRNVARQLVSLDARLLGVVLNDADLRRSSYYKYDYRYGYSHKPEEQASAG